MVRTLILAASFACLPIALCACSKEGGTAAAEGAPIPLLLKDHRFTPAEIHVPANKPFAVMVTNADGVADEFDSDSLKREKVVAGGQKGIVHVGPLPAGRYPFMGEYHAKTAQGAVIVE
jgi:hypothetical protein